MYSFRDNWVGDVYYCDTLRQAKKEARKLTYGHTIAIYDKKGNIVCFVEPKENEYPLP